MLTTTINESHARHSLAAAKSTIATILAIFKRPQPRRPHLLSIRWAPIVHWKPAISRVDSAPRGFFAVNRATRVLRCLALIGLGLCVSYCAKAQLNGSFTNSGSGWSGVGPATNGSPHVVTNSSGKTVCRIGADGATPGAPGGGVRSTGRNVCTTSTATYCAVHFHADWTPVGTETATVRVSFKNSDGQSVVTRTIKASGDHVVNGKDQCPSQVQVTFTIDSGGKPVAATLDISDVSIVCDSLDNSTLAMIPQPLFGDPPAAAYPLPYGSGQSGALAVAIPQGLSPLANPFSSGSNSLDEVLVAADGTMLYKYNPLTQVFDTYSCDLGHWSPDGGTLGPGDAAFIDSPVPQQFDFAGQYQPMPFGQHPASGSAYFANPVPWPLLLEDVMGFKPVLGDVLLMYRHGDTNTAPPGTMDSMFIFQPDNFALQPVISPGETVQVFFGDPAKVPIEIVSLGLTSAAPISNIVVTAPGDLPSSGLLQTADSLTPNARWKSLLGVADYYIEPATNSARFFRLGFNPPKGQLYCFLAQTNGAPAPGLTVQPAPNGNSQTTDGSGRVSFFDIPLGLLDLDITTPVQTFDPTTGRVSIYPFTVPFPVQLNSPVTTVNISQNVAVAFTSPPACPCKPATWIMKSFVNGAWFVRVGGSSVPNPCPAGNVTVTITDPNGTTVNPGPAGMDYNPAPNGVYRVTATICGVTVSSTVTVP